MIIICCFQAELKERISEVDDDSVDSPEPPPPVPRRMVGVVRPTSVASEDTITRRSVTAANYENIVKKDRKIFENIGVEMSLGLRFYARNQLSRVS